MKFPQYRRLQYHTAIFKFTTATDCEVHVADEYYQRGEKYSRQNVDGPGWLRIGPANTYITI